LAVAHTFSAASFQYEFIFLHAGRKPPLKIPGGFSCLDAYHDFTIRAMFGQTCKVISGQRGQFLQEKEIQFKDAVWAQANESRVQVAATGSQTRIVSSIAARILQALFLVLSELPFQSRPAQAALCH
jgi:hypothetical protein